MRKEPLALIYTLLDMIPPLGYPRWTTVVLRLGLGLTGCSANQGITCLCCAKRDE